MKNLLLLFFLSSYACFGQINLSISQKPKNPLSDQQHEYILDLENTSYQSLQYTIETQVLACKENNTQLRLEIQNEWNREVSADAIEAKDIKRIKILLSKDQITQLNSWYCLSIRLISTNTQEDLSPPIEIEHFIPNPKNFM